MATIGGTYLSLADKLRRTDPDGERIATVIELLSRQNEILQDAIAVEGNLPTGHRTTIRSGLPEATWRKLYQGVPPSKSRTVQVDDTCGMLEAYSIVDKALADLNGNTAEFRLSEATAFVEAMNQAFADTFINGNTDQYPDRFMGLVPRFNVAPGTDKTISSYNIIDAGGAGADNTSIWFVTWDPAVCHLIYPKGSMAGIQHQDQGQQTVLDANGNPYEAYRAHWKWDVGLSVRDWRGISRVGSVDLSDLDAGSLAIENYMIDAYYRTTDTPGTKVVYVNRRVAAALHKRAITKNNVNLTIEEFAGKKITAFLGVPIRIVEAIGIAETAI